MSFFLINQIRQIAKFDPDAKKLIAADGIISLTSGFMYTDFSVYLNQMGYDPLRIGFLLSLSTLTASFLTLFAAGLSDKFGRRRIIIAGFFPMFIGTLIYTVTFSYSFLIVAAVLNGISFASIGSSFMALLTEKTKPENRNSVFATSSLMNGLAMTTSMVIGGLPPVIATYFHVTTFDSFRPLFAFGLFCEIAAFLVFYGVRENYKGKDKISFLPKKASKFVIKLSILGFIGLGAGMVVELFPLWFYLKFGINVNSIGPLFAASMLLTSLASFLTPEIAKKFGNVKTIAYTEATSITILAVLPFASIYLAAPLFVIRNILMNMSSPIMNSFIMGIIPEEERATSSAIIGLFDSIPRSFGPALGGYFFNLGDLPAPFLIAATLYSVSIGFFFELFKSVESKGHGAINKNIPKPIGD